MNGGEGCSNKSRHGFGGGSTPPRLSSPGLSSISSSPGSGQARDRLREEGLILSVQRGGRGIYQRATAEQAKHQIRRYGKKASNSIARALDTASAIPEEDLSPHGRDTLKRTTSKLEQIQGAVSAYRSSKKDFDFIPSPRPSARDN
jgi:hypothetical protein